MLHILANTAAFAYGFHSGRTRRGARVGSVLWLGVAAFLLIPFTIGIAQEPLAPSNLFTVPIVLWMVRGCVRIALKPLPVDPPPRARYEEPRYEQPTHVTVLQQQPDGTWA